MEYQIQNTGDYTTRVVTSGGYTYIGESIPGTETSSALWRVSRVDASGNLLYADGNANFDNVWDNYATLSYS